MTNGLGLSPHRDQSGFDWANAPLPNAWPDDLNFARPADLLLFLQHVCGFRRSKVKLPDEMPGRERIPRYALLEFHNLPNGNYSKAVTRGYVNGFDRVMLGQMGRARRWIAKAMTECHSVLDVGCGGGRLAAELRRVGVEDVWGLDPSPYLLQHAARDNPGIRFVQGVAEETGFGDRRFDGIAACFLFHEIPPDSFERSLQEFKRILKPGGLLAICEPSAIQFDAPLRVLLARCGVAGLYFRYLARLVFEPFVKAWHGQDIPAVLAKHGFVLIDDREAMPVRHILARLGDTRERPAPESP
jgi:ubiquinone/menaquinone biosynthesis C-methylase UbiE